MNFKENCRRHLVKMQAFDKRAINKKFCRQKENIYARRLSSVKVILKFFSSLEQCSKHLEKPSSRTFREARDK